MGCGSLPIPSDLIPWAGIPSGKRVTAPTPRDGEVEVMEILDGLERVEILEILERMEIVEILERMEIKLSTGCQQVMHRKPTMLPLWSCWGDVVGSLWIGWG